MDERERSIGRHQVRGCRRGREHYLLSNEDKVLYRVFQPFVCRTPHVTYMPISGGLWPATYDQIDSSSHEPCRVVTNPTIAWPYDPASKAIFPVCFCLSPSSS